ncbi:hypothetical protein ACEXOS_021315 [Herbiconiux sp. P16]|uniref:hypothetical protein n=1 Tax=Herbiconiux wuyangfengii TaxID=3342794 RepID=UPI0035B7E0FA
MTWDRVRPAPPWRRRMPARVAGSFASWFFVTLGAGLLFVVTGRVMAVGGSCASGGPYEIAVPCPAGVELLVPLSLVSAGLGIVAMVVFAPDFGVSLIAFGWLLLFGGLGTFFLQAFFGYGDPVGLIVGIVFVVMGLGPLGYLLFTAPRAVFLGRSDARGRLYAPDGAQLAGLADYVLSMGIWVLASAAGFAVALALTR